MNQQEWIEYFELVNGRKPTPAELYQAQATGEFILERSNILSSNGQVREQRPIKPAKPVIAMTQQPQFAQTAATFQQVVYLSLAATHYGVTNQVRLRMEHTR